MEYVTATDAKNMLGTLIAKAQRGPVTIRKQNRDAAVLISPEDYARLTRLNIEEFRAYREALSAQAARQGLTQAALDDILGAGE